MRLRRIVGTVSFLLVGMLIFCGLSEVLRRKTGETVDMVHSFYEIEEDTLDVLFLGSSHAYYSISPNELWREHGITSYIMGSPEQTTATSYFLLKEAFTRQKPEVVVLESYYLWDAQMYHSEARLREAFDGMRLGKTKVEMLHTMLSDAEPKELLTYYVPFLKYHSRWAELENHDFVTEPFLKGGRLDFETADAADPGIPKKGAKIPENSITYLEKIMELCEENDAEFMMIAAPYGIDTDKKVYKKRQGINPTLDKYLEEKGVPFLFYQRDYPELIDFDTDFRDKTHLNAYGAKKLTHHLGGWLAEQYGLENHREDPAYASWNEDLAKYDKESKRLKAEAKE